MYLRQSIPAFLRPLFRSLMYSPAGRTGWDGPTMRARPQQLRCNHSCKRVRRRSWSDREKCDCGVEEDQHAGMSDGGDGRKRANENTPHQRKGNWHRAIRRQPQAAASRDYPHHLLPAPRAVLALLPLLPPSLKLGFPLLLFTLRWKQLPRRRAAPRPVARRRR
ncbi:hypothetical protein EDB89DRAFT_1947941 [Lactarius sanguifluus]|nr:hypothetical protein EDB89DRAFT_1947941 [Lactarius sanguifluus]